MRINVVPLLKNMPSTSTSITDLCRGGQGRWAESAYGANDLVSGESIKPRINPSSPLPIRKQWLMCHHAQQLRARSRFRCDATVCTGPLPRKVQMARFIPVRSQCQFDTSGERRFAERLEDDYLDWPRRAIPTSSCFICVAASPF